MRAGADGSSGRSQWIRSAAAQLFALGLVAAATMGRLLLGEAFVNVAPFSLYYPAVLLAALAGGWPAALTALVASTLSGWWLFFVPMGLVYDRSETAVNLTIYVASAAGVGFGGVYVRQLIARLRDQHELLAERELRYRTLFDTVSEGFALVEAIRDENGRLVDYVVLEANPALLRILGLDASVVGRRQSEVLPNVSPAYLSACHRALKGEEVSFEYQSPHGQHWYELRLSRVGENRLAQFIVDITARKTTDARQTELFDELNHRMKNNLAMVSSMLALQARMGEAGTVRAHLMKAVDRIQAIADVHASLYRESRKDDVDFAAYLHDLCTRLAGSLIEGDRVKIECEAEPATLPLDRAVALGVVVNELITNAAKYAYPPPAEGVISVKLQYAGAGLTLSVRDSGQGLPEEPPNTGLGMRLVRSLVQQIGATLEIERQPGATFRVNLPQATPTPAAGAAAGQARLF
ncbi:sensor histidine kinase [Phenylobacterium sp.]|jgi:PAS domain S-box-containing protein|uniref:sensor histidine kinase n=1 Tax=Phenylobacterium sp. TaxID=1871053 RepID=UPI002F9298B1